MTSQGIHWKPRGYPLSYWWRTKEVKHFVQGHIAGVEWRQEPHFEDGKIWALISTCSLAAGWLWSSSFSTESTFSSCWNDMWSLPHRFIIYWVKPLWKFWMSSAWPHNPIPIYSFYLVLPQLVPGLRSTNPQLTFFPHSVLTNTLCLYLCDNMVQGMQWGCSLATRKACIHWFILAVSEHHEALVG